MTYKGATLQLHKLKEIKMLSSIRFIHWKSHLGSKTFYYAPTPFHISSPMTYG